MKPIFQKVRGMHDILQDRTRAWQAVENAYCEVMDIYNYSQVRIPVLEATGLFRRSIGDDTDIVGKEMYSFIDTGGDELTLRPEGTAGAVRAYVEHSIAASEPVTKWYYIGPMFRRERPQKGRYRQFHQAGAEVLGSPPPLADAELAVMLADFFRRVGLEHPVIVYNHLGGDETRERFREALRGWYGARETEICVDCRRRLRTNPLRLLDCKLPGCVALKQGAPDIRESLGEADRDTLARYRRLLESSCVPAREAPRLVRGLDYYTGIVFEVEVSTDDGPVIVAGGGRYDGLVERLGGPATPAAGYAIGLERLIECIPDVKAPGLDLFVLVPDPSVEAEAMNLLGLARSKGMRADADPRGGSFKSQMKRADKAGAAFVAILGADELGRGALALRDMRSSDQVEVALGSAIGMIAGRLGR